MKSVERLWSFAMPPGGVEKWITEKEKIARGCDLVRVFATVWV